MIDISVREPYDEFSVNKALSKLKKIMTKNGILEEVKERRYFKSKSKKIREYRKKTWKRK